MAVAWRRSDSRRERDARSEKRDRRRERGQARVVMPALVDPWHLPALRGYAEEIVDGLARVVQLGEGLFVAERCHVSAKDTISL
jgi:hypothetical protein